MSIGDCFCPPHFASMAAQPAGPESDTQNSGDPSHLSACSYIEVYVPIHI